MTRGFTELDTLLRILLLCCGLLGAGQVMAQQDARPRYDAMSQQLVAAFNTEEPLALYALTSPAYQARMSAANFSTGTRKFYIQTGYWETVQFREQVPDGLTYTAKFERETAVLFLQLDETGKISRFNFKIIPFVSQPKTYRVPSNNPLRTAIDSLVEKLARPYMQQGPTAGLCLAVLDRGQVRRYSYGETQRGNGQLPDPNTTIFEIGSVTKTFTTLLLARQVVRGKMHLADPVSQYLPDSLPRLAYQAAPISLENLANHTSGLPRLPANIYVGKVDPADPYRHYTLDSLCHFLARYQLPVRPGSQFTYSNLGAGLLGCVLAQQAHRSFDQLIRTQISRPLHMPDTHVELTAQERTRFAQGYNEKGEPTTVWNLATLQGSGALKSTLRDMVRYTQAQLGQFRNPLAKAIALTHQETFRSPDNTLGLGWRIAQRPQHTYWHHSGGTGGGRSFVGFDRQRQLGVVILSNAAVDVTSMGQAILEQ